MSTNTNTKEERTIPFLITASYLIAFLLIRTAVLIAGSAESEFARVAKEGLTPDARFYIGRNIILFGHHIHHFYLGVFLMAVAGWFAIVGSKIFSRRHAAVIYGAGLGLFMDEVGLLLTWGDYYSGVTYLLSLLVIGVLLNVVFFPSFWQEVRETLVETNPQSVAWTMLQYGTFIKVADTVSEKTGTTERASLIFTGFVYLGVGALILLYPQFVYYWVAGVFLIQGVASLIRAR